MTSGGTTTTDLLASAQAARERGDWRTVYNTLTAVSTAAGDELPPEALHLCGTAAWWLGLCDESMALTEQAFQRYLEQDRVDRAADSAAEVAITAMMRGDGALASGWLNRSRRLLVGRDECLTHGLLTFADCLIAIGSSDLTAVLAAASRLQALGSRLSEPTLTALGLMAEGIVAIRRGDVADGFRLLDEAMLPVVGHQVIPEFAGSIYCMVMSSCVDLADFDRARQWITLTESWARQFSDAVEFIGICRIHRVQLMGLEGDWHAAEAEALRICDQLCEVNVSVVAEGFYQVGEVRRLRGALDSAADAYRQARALGRSPQPGEALLLLARGDPGRAWAAIERALAEAGDDAFVRARLLMAAAEIGCAGGRRREAEQAMESLREIAERYDSPGLRIWAHHAAGAVLLANGDPQRAASELDQAGIGYQSLRATYDAARVRLLRADCHRQLGEEDAASADRAVAYATMAELGVDSSASPTASHGLSPREVEVLRHLVAGSSNRVIGASLFITEKTVGRHLSNIYRKLDLHSRTEAVAWAHAHGIEPVP